MDFLNIADFLEDNGLSEVKELRAEDNHLVINFYYDFDKEELEAARAYANDESDVEEESDEWYNDWYYSYLIDIVNDNVEEIFEDLNEEFSLESSFKVSMNNVGTIDSVQIYAAICDEDCSEDLEELISEYL